MTTIRGVASVFGVDSAPGEDGSRLRVEPGAFMLAGAIVPLCFGHDQSRHYASTLDRSLRLWQTDLGLQFEADVEDSRAGHGLVAGILRGSYNAVSCLYPADRRSRIESIGDARIEVVERTRIGEISIVTEGACPGAVAWSADDDLESMAPAIRAAAALWRTPSAWPAPAPRFPGGGNAAPPPRAGRAELAAIDRILAAAGRR